jgi:hypothetical protein
MLIDQKENFTLSGRYNDQPWTNIYKNTKPSVSDFLKKLTSKGTWQQVFICLRPPPLLGFVWGG